MNSTKNFIFSALHRFRYGDKFTYANIESKIKINGLLSDPLTLVCLPKVFPVDTVHTAAEVLSNLINTDKRNKKI